jgi:transcriptional activator HAC1
METPIIKFESSPTETLIDSFDVSSPATHFSSIFDGFDMDRTLNPSDLDGSEYSFDDTDKLEKVMASGSNTPSEGTPQPQNEKKAVKKRKSWGQQLPEPKTNLPPRYVSEAHCDETMADHCRKRAKTEDEKEQRRVERVLRNRRAAQTSRERKRQEVEALEAEKMAIERRNRDLEMRLAEAEARNVALEQQLARLSRASSPYTVQSSPVQQIQSSPTQVTQLTFSQPLFPSNDSAPFEPLTTPHNLPSSLDQTIDPSSLSPSLRPVDDASNASYADMTQHSAAVLWDLQCQSAQQRPWTRRPTPLSLLLLLTTISTATSAILTPLAAILSSLRTRSSLSPTPSVLSCLIWLLTTPSTSTSASISTRPPRFSVRISLLRRLLACSPRLARPLLDATMSAMRSVSERRAGSAAETAQVAAGPGVEALATLAWAVCVFERERGGVGRKAGVSLVREERVDVRGAVGVEGV